MSLDYNYTLNCEEIRKYKFHFSKKDICPKKEVIKERDLAES